MITAILGTIVFYLKFRVAFSDPGIVSRLENIFEEEEEIKQIPFNTSYTPALGVSLINADGHSISYKICETCRIYKNKNMRHCRSCDNCVC